MLKGVSMCDKVEHEYEEACAKDMLTNVKVKNKKVFVVVEQGQG